MKEKFSQLYEEMMSDVKRLLKKELPELERAESCYRITLKYWEEVKKDCTKIKFADQSEEIEFFREIKPRFTCQIEYYIFLYEALLMEPKNSTVNSIQDIIRFWEDEPKRYKRFYDKNEEFIQYYESGKRHFDSQYFIRTNKNPGITSTVRMYDMDSGLYSLYGQLLTTWLANKMYHEYVQAKIEELKGIITAKPGISLL